MSMLDLRLAELSDFKWLTFALMQSFPSVEFKTALFDFNGQFGIAGAIYDSGGRRRRFAYRTDVLGEGYSDGHKASVVTEARSDFAAWLGRVFL